MPHDAAEIARMLAGRIDRLCAELLPGGRRIGGEWRAGGIGGEAGQSLGVRLSGHKSGVWSDFAGGIGGDALDLVAHALYRGQVKPALVWARRWLGLSDGEVAIPDRAAVPVRDANTDDDDKRTASAQRLFFEADSSIAGTPVDAYLAARAIDLRAMGRLPRALRYAPNLWCAEARQTMPAMVAAIVRGDGGIIAVHRTYLDRIDGVWQKAKLRDPKKTIGAVSGGSIRLWRGVSGKPISEATESDHLVVAEGIENALSIAVLCPDRRVIAGISVGNLARIDLPPQIRTVTIAADPDRWDSQAASARQVAIDRFIGEGRRVLVARPPAGGDFNDALMSGGAP